MNTYFIANNKTGVCAIYQTDRHINDVMFGLDDMNYDVIISCEDVDHAIELKNKGGYETCSFSDFYK